MSSCLRCALESSLLRNLGTGGTAAASVGLWVDVVVESLEGVGASVGASGGAGGGGGDDDEGDVERSCHSSV